MFTSHPVDGKTQLRPLGFVPTVFGFVDRVSVKHKLQMRPLRIELE